MGGLRGLSQCYAWGTQVLSGSWNLLSSFCGIAWCFLWAPFGLTLALLSSHLSDFLALGNPPRGYGVGKPSLGHGCHVGDLFWVQRVPKRMVECGLWLPQVIPQVKIVFGRKSLDDVIPGSWYIIPLPSIEKFGIGPQFFWKFLSCEDSGAIVCLSTVLSVFKLTLLL